MLGRLSVRQSKFRVQTVEASHVMLIMSTRDTMVFSGWKPVPTFSDWMMLGATTERGSARTCIASVSQRRYDDTKHRD
jgi:hypothetical protein